MSNANQSTTSHPSINLPTSEWTTVQQVGDRKIDRSSTQTLSTFWTIQVGLGLMTPDYHHSLLISERIDPHVKSKSPWKIRVDIANSSIMFNSTARFFWWLDLIERTSMDTRKNREHCANLFILKSQTHQICDGSLNHRTNLTLFIVSLPRSITASLRRWYRLWLCGCRSKRRNTVHGGWGHESTVAGTRVKDRSILTGSTLFLLGCHAFHRRGNWSIRRATTHEFWAGLQPADRR
jgi:hypothetical protein